MSLGWIETRTKACEESIEWIKRWIQDWTPLIKASLQNARTASQGGGSYGGGSSAGAFFATPGSSVAGNASFTANVYSFVAGTATLVATGATIYNNFAAALVASKQCFVVSDGAGNWVVVTQSCT
jgi:hypothetical protein